MSFSSATDIQTLIEGLLSYCWPSDRQPLQTPFRRMTYDDAIRWYGSDKPDTRFDMKVCGKKKGNGGRVEGVCCIHQ